MRHSRRLPGLLAALIAGLIAFTAGVDAAPISSGIPKVERDGTMRISGRSLRCRNVRNVLDRRLPSEGAAAPGVLIINPRLIARMPETVRLFVYFHECGHHYIGASELGADCWAVHRGVNEGWLDRTGLRQVCRSFGNMPRTPTHPSSRSRCRNLDRCYARAMAGRAPLPIRNPVLVQGSTADPILVSGPKLIGTGKIQADGNEDRAASFRSRAPRRVAR